MIPLQAVPIVRWQLGNAGFRPMMASRRMAEGIMAAPTIQPGAVSVLQAGIDRIVDALNTEIQALFVETDLVSPSALRVDPTSPTEISSIGNLPPQEIRTAIATAAQELSNLSARVTSGSLSNYATAGQVARLSELKSQADQVSAVMRNQDLMPISPGDQAQVQSYLNMHLAAPNMTIGDAEKSLVTAEAGSVPVLEPSEKNGSLKIAIGVGLVAVAGLVLWQVLG